MRDISLLLPIVQLKTKEFLSKGQVFLDGYLVKGYTLILSSTYRTLEEQTALWEQGRTKPGPVVTNAKAGESMHNYRCAIDFAIVDQNGNMKWDDKDLFTKIGEIGESIGFEWGGRWPSFLDLPHLQYTAGYTLQDFETNSVDLSKFGATEDVFRNKLALALKEWQISVGINDFASETDPKKIKFGPKSQKLFNN